MLNRWVLSQDRKTATEGAEVTRSGRLFQIRAAATGKARSPTVDSRVRLTISDEDELERSRWQASTSATWQSSSVRYAGADPWRHLYTRTAYQLASELSAVLHHHHGILPASVPYSDSLAKLKSKLKTHLFITAHSGLQPGFPLAHLPF